MSKEKFSLMYPALTNQVSLTSYYPSLIDLTVQFATWDNQLHTALLSLSIFIELGSEDKDYPVIKELLFSAKKTWDGIRL